MNGCLSERALLALFGEEEENPQGRSHLRLCADCTERYEALAEDLELIGAALNGPPPARIRKHVLALRPRLLAAAAAGTFAAFVIGLTALHHATPPAAAHRNTLSAFASDVSEAVFANAAVGDDSQLTPDTAYMRAALEADWPCTQDRFLDGECTDQVSALLFEGN